jgi:hypothetical protein
LRNRKFPSEPNRVRLAELGAVVIGIAHVGAPTIKAAGCHAQTMARVTGLVTMKMPTRRRDVRINGHAPATASSLQTLKLTLTGERVVLLVAAFIALDADQCAPFRAPACYAPHSG